MLIPNPTWDDLSGRYSRPRLRVKKAFARITVLQDRFLEFEEFHDEKNTSLTCHPTLGSSVAPQFSTKILREWLGRAGVNLDTFARAYQPIGRNSSPARKRGIQTFRSGPKGMVETTSTLQQQLNELDEIVECMQDVEAILDDEELGVVDKYHKLRAIFRPTAQDSEDPNEGADVCYACGWRLK